MIGKCCERGRETAWIGMKIQVNTNTNTKAFFELVRAGLWEQEVQPSQYDNIDFAEVYRLAEEQSVIGLVAAGIDSSKIQDSGFSCPKEWALQFVGQALQLEQQNQAMNAFVAQLVKKMRAAGIYALLLKGQGVAQCYDKPTWRACGDVDLFLSDENYQKAKAFLIPLVSSVEREYEREKHLGMTIDQWVVELHGRLYCGLSSRSEKELGQVYQDTFYEGNVRSWDNNHVQVFLLSPENDAFYVFTHILQHFYKGGIGLRQICDWCRLLWTFREKLDLRLLESRIRKAGLMSEWKAFGVYAVEYLGMPIEAMPFYSGDRRWIRKAKRINSFIFSVGNMGHNRDSSYHRKYPFLIRKSISTGRRIGDLVNHARIFPLDSLRFSFAFLRNGVKSALRGEG